MSKMNRMLELTSNKTQKIGMKFNPELWALFKKTCEEEGIKSTIKIKIWILDYLDEKNKL